MGCVDASLFRGDEKKKGFALLCLIYNTVFVQSVEYVLCHGHLHFFNFRFQLGTRNQTLKRRSVSFCIEEPYRYSNLNWVFRALGRSALGSPVRNPGRNRQRDHCPFGRKNQCHSCQDPKSKRFALCMIAICESASHGSQNSCFFASIQ